MRNDSDFPDVLSEVYHSLSASRRCYVIHILSKSSKECQSVRTLARQIAAIEEDVEPDHATGKPYRNVYNALAQTHLSTLADTEIIVYDSNRQIVAPGPLFDVAAFLIIFNKSIYEYLQRDSFEHLVRNQEGSITD